MWMGNEAILRNSELKATRAANTVYYQTAREWQSVVKRGGLKNSEFPVLEDGSL